MSANNPDITASDIITDVEVRLGDTNLSTANYLPWVSYAYQKVYHAIISAGQQAKEVYFGDYATFDLTAGTAEYTLTDEIPRFGGIIKVEIKYGGTDDDWVKCARLPSIANYSQTTDDVSTTYRAKSSAAYYRLKNKIGFVPTPPTTDSGTPQAKIYFIQRPYQITDGADVIDIPYRYQFAINDYVQSKALQAENESYAESGTIEKNFEYQLSRITELVENEFGEHEGTDSVQVMSGSKLRSNPLAKA